MSRAIQGGELARNGEILLLREKRVKLESKELFA